MNGMWVPSSLTYLEITTDPQMAVYAKSFSGNNPGPGQVSHTFSSNFLPDTTYYWRVYFICDDYPNGPYSDVWSFTTGSGGTILPAPSLQSPALQDIQVFEEDGVIRVVEH